MVGIYIGRNNKSDTPVTQTKAVAPIQTSSLQSVEKQQFTKEAIVQFWTDHMERTFREELLVGKCPDPIINERCQVLMGMLNERYHKQLAVQMINTFNPLSEWILAGCFVNDEGVPVADLNIPASMRIHENLILTDGPELGEKMFIQTVLTGFLHELDHLAYGFVAKKGHSQEELVYHEKKAWAKTCELTLTPLAARKVSLLGNSERAYLDAWVKSGRDENSLLWDKFIRETYEEARGTGSR